MEEVKRYHRAIVGFLRCSQQFKDFCADTRTILEKALCKKYKPGMLRAYRLYTKDILRPDFSFETWWNEIGIWTTGYHRQENVEDFADHLWDDFLLISAPRSTIKGDTLSFDDLEYLIKDYAQSLKNLSDVVIRIRLRDPELSSMNKIGEILRKCKKILTARLNSREHHIKIENLEMALQIYEMVRVKKMKRKEIMQELNKSDKSFLDHDEITEQGAKRFSRYRSNADTIMEQIEYGRPIEFNWE